jgi:hypothetical protein
MINILTVCAFIINTSFCINDNDTSQALKIILSKKYYSTYIFNSSFKINDSLVAKTESKGYSKRIDTYVYSKFDNGLTIYEDSNSLLIDTAAKRFMLGSILNLGSFLIIPSHDPFEIWYMSNKYKTNFQEKKDDNTISYIFQFPKENFPMTQITFIFNLKTDVSEFKIKLFQEYSNDKITEEVDYKIDSTFDKKHLLHIKDFVKKKNGKNVPKSKLYSNYMFSGMSLH